METPKEKKTTLPGRTDKLAKKEISPEDIMNRIELRRKFGKGVARYFMAAETCQKGYEKNKKVVDIGLYADLQEAKKNFYEALDAFRENGYAPSDKINPESLARLDEYKNAKWTDEDVIKELKIIIRDLME